MLTKTCSKCGESKPVAAFYANANGTHGRMPYCKKCDNARPRKATGLKVNRMRARHRATADLIDMHREDFDALLAIRLAEAMDEAEALAETPEAKEHFKAEPVRLRPGKRMPGEKAGDRIDVARCPHCVRHHDRGHVCGSCGAAPSTANRLPDDGVLDEIAVERAMNGDVVRITPAERVEAIRRLAGKGFSDAQIAARVHLNIKKVLRDRIEHGIDSRWSA